MPFIAFIIFLFWCAVAIALGGPLGLIAYFIYLNLINK